jgi:hypothetical protein
MMMVFFFASAMLRLIAVLVHFDNPYLIDPPVRFVMDDRQDEACYGATSDSDVAGCAMTELGQSSNSRARWRATPKV